MIAVDVLRWPGVNQSFLAAFIGALVMALAIIPYGKRRPIDAPFDWGQAMLASVGVSTGRRKIARRTTSLV